MILVWEPKRKYWGKAKRTFFYLGMGDKFVQNELLCRNCEMLKHGALECNDLGGVEIFLIWDKLKVVDIFVHYGWGRDI